MLAGVFSWKTNAWTANVRCLFFNALMSVRSTLHWPKKPEIISHGFKDSDPGAWIVSAVGSVLLILILASFFFH